MKLEYDGENFIGTCGEGKCDIEKSSYKPENRLNEEGTYDVFCERCGKLLTSLTPSYDD